MKKFIITSLAFFIVMIIPFSIINLFQSHYNTTPEFYKFQYDAVQKRSNYFEGIIIGSSRSVCAIRPSILDSSGITFYNYSLPAANPKFYYQWYNNVYRNNHPAPYYCIIGFNWYLFDSHILSRRFEQDAEFFSHFLFLKTLLETNDFNKKDVLVNRYPVIKFRKKIVQSLNFQKGNINNPISTYDRGYNSAKSMYNPKKFLTTKQCLIEPCQLICFIKLIQQLLDEKVKIILVMPPEYGFEPEFYKRSRTLLIINELSKKYRIPVLNFNTELRSYINDDINFFADWQHMNGKGSMVFSRRLAKELCIIGFHTGCKN